MRLRTNQIVGGDNDTTNEQYCAGDAIVTAKDHIVNYRLVDQITNLDETGNAG